MGKCSTTFHASLKLERTERKEGKVRRIYGDAQTPLARVLASRGGEWGDQAALAVGERATESVCR